MVLFVLSDDGCMLAVAITVLPRCEGDMSLRVLLPIGVRVSWPPGAASQRQPRVTSNRMVAWEHSRMSHCSLIKRI